MTNIYLIDKVNWNSGISVIEIDESFFPSRDIKFVLSLNLFYV